MEDNFLFMDSMVSYPLQYKLSVPFSFNVHSSVMSQVYFWVKKYERDPPEDDFSPSSFLSACLLYVLLFKKNHSWKLSERQKL